ncbi:hypothetical protein IW146_006912 [Coemansia sp. RSA 922]|nr:hypothetical protein GGI14_002016 [Coemansia sp. S680]KAJ2098986.1 hypothetical protein GGI09_003024 [Coemansia sp. S100]KAJ2108269.1 hypothetical protein IW146_006912 [Coemansia sp. RSA 922]
MDNSSSGLPKKQSHSERSYSGGEESGPIESNTPDGTLLLLTAPTDNVDDEPVPQEEDEMVRESLSLDVVWRGNERYPLRIPKYATILSVKALLEELTGVDAESQKLLGLVRGQLPRDSDTLVGLGVSSGTKVRLLGTPLCDRLQPRDSNPWESPPPPPGDEWGGGDRRQMRSQVLSNDWQVQLQRIVADTEVRVLNAPRAGRKLVVLDLDYTLFDCKNVSGNVTDMARPGLHEFLAAIYPHYDLIVWSQTRWHIVESKITLLGMLTHPHYRITTALDISSMFTVHVLRNGKEVDHQVKPLEFIWSRFPEHYGKHNTIHVDDLSRNFALNWQNGLKIRAFKRADTQLRADTELYKLTKYLLQISALPSLEALDHSQWQGHK